MIDVVIQTSEIYGRPEPNAGGGGAQLTDASSASAGSGAVVPAGGGDNYDEKSFSVIKLSNGLVLCLREVDR